MKQKIRNPLNLNFYEYIDVIVQFVEWSTNQTKKHFISIFKLINEISFFFRSLTQQKKKCFFTLLSPQ